MDDNGVGLDNSFVDLLHDQLGGVVSIPAIDIGCHIMLWGNRPPEHPGNIQTDDEEQPCGATD